MSKNPLNVIKDVEIESWSSGRHSRREETQAKFERLWLIAPEQFGSGKNCMELERIERTMQLICEMVQLKGCLAADLGCGDGELSRRLRDGGATVDAVDIASKAGEALKTHGMTNITFHQDYVPNTTLRDDFYDLVVSTEMVALLPHQEHRLYLSELARLVKPEGLTVCSTSLDMHSEDPLHTFSSLTDTEFKVEKWVVSHHRLYLRLLDFFAAPARFAKASKDREYRSLKLEERRGFSLRWFGWNSSKVAGLFWSIIQWVSNPFAHLLRRSRGLMLFLEKICRGIWSDRGITHAIWIGHRRPLEEETPVEQRPMETKHKKQVWE